MTNLTDDKPENELQREASQAVTGMLTNDLKDLLVETMEKIFVPVAQIEIISRKYLLTEKEVGLLFSISPASLRTERSRGTGPGYIKDGKRVLYKREDLAAYYTRRAIRRVD